MSQPRTLRIIGIHLAGPSTRKSAVVRTAVRMDAIKPSRLNHSSELNPLYQSLMQKLNLPFDENIQISKTTYPTLFWEAFSPEIGSHHAKDSDGRLLEVISDLGPADIYCIDAPLSLPPFLSQQTKEMELLKAEAQMREANGKYAHSKPPLPYLDRFFEYHARRVFNHPRITGQFEFEAILGSGRAPLTARALHLSTKLHEQFPKALILESNAYANLVGWAVNVGFNLPRSVDYRFGEDGRKLRLNLFKKIEQTRYAARSASLHTDLLVELCHKPETFSAGLSALSAWGLLNGHIYLTPEFVQISPNEPLRGWACVPLDISFLAWSKGN